MAVVVQAVKFSQMESEWLAMVLRDVDGRCADGGVLWKPVAFAHMLDTLLVGLTVMKESELVFVIMQY